MSVVRGPQVPERKNDPPQRIDKVKSKIHSVGFITKWIGVDFISSFYRLVLSVAGNNHQHVFRSTHFLLNASFVSKTVWNVRSWLNRDETLAQI